MRRRAPGDRSIQYGLIAEEVAVVFPELPVFDRNAVHPDREGSAHSLGW